MKTKALEKSTKAHKQRSQTLNDTKEQHRELYYEVLLKAKVAKKNTTNNPNKQQKNQGRTPINSKKQDLTINALLKMTREKEDNDKNNT